MNYKETSINEEYKYVEDYYIEESMPNIKIAWETTKNENKLNGCGVHKNLTYEEIEKVQKSLFEMRFLAGIETVDEVERNNKFVSNEEKEIRSDCSANEKIKYDELIKKTEEIERLLCDKLIKNMEEIEKLLNKLKAL